MSTIPTWSEIARIALLTLIGLAAFAGLGAIIVAYTRAWGKDDR